MPAIHRRVVPMALAAVLVVLGLASRDRDSHHGPGNHRIGGDKTAKPKRSAWRRLRSSVTHRG